MNVCALMKSQHGSLKKTAKEALDYVGWQEMESGRVYCDDCLDSGEINFGDSNNEDDYDN